MRAIALAASLLAASWAGAARGETVDARDWYRRAEALVQSLIGGGSASDREIIMPPDNIDPKMAFVPPFPLGTMRIIPPPGEAGPRP